MYITDNIFQLTLFCHLSDGIHIDLNKFYLNSYWHDPYFFQFNNYLESI